MGDADASLHFGDTIEVSRKPLDTMGVLSDTPHNTAVTLQTPTPAEFVRKRAKNAYCLALTAQVKKPNTVFRTDHHRLLVHPSTIDGAVEIVAPSSLRQRILTVAHYSPLAGRSG